MRFLVKLGFFGVDGSRLFFGSAKQIEYWLTDKERKAPLFLGLPKAAPNPA
jgi:hypothetical protein